MLLRFKGRCRLCILTTAIAKVILDWKEPSKEILISVSSFEMKSLCVIEFKIDIPITEILLKITVLQCTRRRCRCGGWLRALKTTIISEDNIIQGDVSAILSSNVCRELEEVKAVLGGVLHHAILPVPDVALVPTDLPQSERLARLRLELQLEAADPAAVHVVVKDDLTLVVSAVPAEDIKTLPLTDHNLPGLEDFAEQLRPLSLGDLLGAVNVEVVPAAVQTGVVEGRPCARGGGVAGADLPLEQPRCCRLKLSEWIVWVLECGL